MKEKNEIIYHRYTEEKQENIMIETEPAVSDFYFLSVSVVQRF